MYILKILAFIILFICMLLILIATMLLKKLL